MHQITDFLQFTCIISTFYESPLKSLLVCKDFIYTTSTFYDNRVRSLLACKVFVDIPVAQGTPVAKRTRQRTLMYLVEIHLKYAKNMKFT